MPRVVVLILVAVQVLMPPGVCLRQCGVAGWLTRITATASSQPSDCHAEPAGTSHGDGCCSECHGRASPLRETSAHGDSPFLACEERPDPPTDHHPDSDCWASCKATSDKLAQHETPQGIGEVVSLGYVPAAPLPARPHVRNGLAAVLSAPPRYVTFCTFLI